MKSGTLKSGSKSIGKFFLAHFLVLTAVSCQLETKHEPAPEEMDSPPLVKEEYSLKADREELREIRGETPVARQIEIDELALILKEMAGETRHPSKVRQKWNKLVRKKRDKFNKDMRKVRASYNKQERKQRTEFLNAQKKSRNQFTKKKVTREERSEFYAEQDSARREYFAEQRDKRSEFESEMREKRKNFDDYMRERTRTFNQEIGAYTKKHTQRRVMEQKEKRRKKKQTKFSNIPEQKHPSQGGLIHKNPEAEAFLNELEEARSLPGQPLKSGH